MSSMIGEKLMLLVIFLIYPYSIANTAPNSLNFAINSSASSFLTSFFMTFGAPSTSSLASFKPNPVIARISLITLIFILASKLTSFTSNAVFVSSLACVEAPSVFPLALDPPPIPSVGSGRSNCFYHTCQ
ncbi:unnamed protein product [Albugo candida]|uniref:Uncharacterized protein n=1 Tax=Albugo candida TaxID=65357 RepID=A0A024GR22_9STRA|nr:unnamed protein product [Albugo candida]|eukprot:CCI48977.1 unnamed protein product [Albugo candida]